MENTESKNQHYVPKFYLRHFSVNGNGKEIRLFNVNSQKFVMTASLKHQGSSNFYYGKDGKIEGALSELEGIQAGAVRYILQTLERPKYYSEKHIELLNFAVTTDLRNPVRKRIYEQITDGAAKKLLAMDPKFKKIPNFQKILDSYEIVPKDSPTYSLGYIQNTVELTVDLHIRILLNNTATPFITSDNPVVRYNQFQESIATSNAITGFGLLGLQMFLPLTEKVMLLFYDEQIYYVGQRRKKHVEITNPNDVDQLNLLQIANCVSNVYGGTNFTQEYANTLYEMAKSFPDFHHVRQSTFPSPSGGQYVIQTVESVKTKLKLSFIFLSTYGGSFPYIGNRIVLRKHAAQVREIRERERNRKGY